MLGFVLVVFAVEQAWPAERRAVLARGHLLDMIYLLVYALMAVTLAVLIVSGFSAWSPPRHRMLLRGAPVLKPETAAEMTRERLTAVQRANVWPGFSVL